MNNLKLHDLRKAGGERSQKEKRDVGCGESPIVPGDGELQDTRDRDPDEIRKLGESDSAVVRPDGFHGPEDRDPDDGDTRHIPPK